MARTTSPSVVIINRNYPPRAGVTGESACALAKYLTNQGVDVAIVTVKSAYAGGGSKMEPVGKVHLIGSWFDGKNKVLRLLSSFMESYRLIRKAKKLGSDQIIVMTDPPFLSFWASRILGKKTTWILWSMDLYPEAFVAGKLASPQGHVYRFLKNSVYRHAPESVIALGPQQAKYLHSQYGEEIETAVLPCGVFEKSTPTELPSWKTKHSDKLILGYCGNLGEAHSPDFLIEIIERFDRNKMHLVVSLYGAKAKIVLDYIKDKMDGITLVDSVTRPELGLIDVHLVSLLDRWANVCVPSKAVSAVCSESAFLFYGSPNCDNWHMLGQAGWLIEQTDNVQLRRQQIGDVLEQMNPASINQKKRAAESIAAKLRMKIRSAFGEIKAWLCG
jgi:hypothetical protein